MIKGMSDKEAKALADIRGSPEYDVDILDSELCFPLIVLQSPIPTAIGRSDGSIVLFNKALEKFIGYTTDEIKNVGEWVERLYPDGEYRDFVWKNVTQALKGEGQDCTVFRITCKDGAEKVASFHTSFFKGGLIIQIVDVTKQYEVEKELKMEKNTVKEFLNVANVIFVTIDSNQNVALINKKGCQILGYNSDDCRHIIGKNWFENFLPKRYVPQVKQVFNNLINGEIQLSEYYENPVLTKTGEERLIAWHNSVLYDHEGNIKYSIGYGEDITDRKALETQFYHAQKMEAIGTLAGGIAHDFNNLLMGILSNATLLRLKEGKTSQELIDIEICGKRAADLTAQLLSFARRGIDTSNIITSNINVLVNNSIGIFSRTRKDIVVHKSLKSDIWSVSADPGQIEQVLMNLFVNASQAMPTGGDLYITTSNISVSEIGSLHLKPGDYIKLSVTDTGCGMSNKTIERAFDPFYTTKEVGRGSGLGLSSAYGIIKNHEGDISLHSVEGEGTTVNVYLPRAEEILFENKIEDDQLEIGSECILLIDDEDIIIKTATRLLSTIGYTVYPEKDGLKAIDFYKNHQDSIDLILLDMVLPGIGGPEIYDTLKKINPKVKVVLMSGYNINGKASYVLEKGCDGFIQKPFSLSEISKKIRSVLDQ